MEAALTVEGRVEPASAINSSAEVEPLVLKWEANPEFVEGDLRFGKRARCPHKRHWFAL